MYLYIILLKSAEANLWVLAPILLAAVGYFYMAGFYGRSEPGESIQVKYLRKFFKNQDLKYGNIFTNERTTTLPNFFKGVALAGTGMRFTANRSYGEKQINNMVENYISKLIDNKVKRFPIEHVEEFMEVQGRVVEKLKKSFWGANDVSYIKQYQRAYAYYNALLQVIEYEKTIGE